VFNPRQPRGHDGKWSAGGVAFRRTVNRSDDAVKPRRTATTQLGQLREKAAISQVKGFYATGDRGRLLSQRAKDATQYQSPKEIARAKRETGQNVKPEAEALATVRSRRRAAVARREVVFNRLSGRFTAQPTQGGATTRASAARAKLAAAQKAAARRQRPKLAASTYVGRRRAEP
jgi:hypothetical protein